MEVKNNQFILSILLFWSLFIMNPQINAMETSKSDDCQTQVIKNLKLTSFFIDKIVKSLQDKMIQIVPDEYAQKVHHYYNTYTRQKYRRSVKLSIIGEEGILKFCGNNLELFEEQLNSWFDEVLDEEQITSAKFIKSFDSSCKDCSINIKDNLSHEESKAIQQNDNYTLSELANVIVPFILKRANLSIQTNEFIQLIKLIIIEFFIQKYNSDNKQQKLTICSCPKVYFGERIIMLVVMINDFYRNNNQDNFTKDNPLVYTSFGSGDLMQDYLAIKLLNAMGFKHFRFVFIDKYYKNKNYTDKLQATLIAQLNRLSIDTFSIEFYKDIFKFLNHNKLKSITSDIIVSIDTSESNSVLEEKAEKLATRALVSFTNKTHNITQTFSITLESKDASKLCTKRHDLYNGFHQHLETKEMKEQTALFQRIIKRDILDSNLSSSQTVRFLKIACNAFNAKVKDLHGYQKNGYKNVEISWRRNPEADFAELVSQAKSQSSFVCILNNHELRNYTKNE